MPDYVADRIQASLEKLNKEHEQLHHSIMRTKRDEQFEMERVKRDFTLRINAMEERQQVILRELINKKQELKRAELRARDHEPVKMTSSISDDKDRRLGRIR